MKRKRITRRGSRKLFVATSGTHPRNLAPEPMRGGIRL